jgi:hypothetical protein
LSTGGLNVGQVDDIDLMLGPVSEGAAEEMIELAWAARGEELMRFWNYRGSRPWAFWRFVLEEEPPSGMSDETSRLAELGDLTDEGYADLREASLLGQSEHFVCRN